MKRAFGFAVAATMVIGGAASADVLYHNPAGGGGTAKDQEYPDFPLYATYLVADFNVPNPGFTLTLVAAPMTVNGDWAAVTTARLHLFPVVGNLPAGGDDPAASVIVAVSYDVNTGVLSTVGLNMDVAAGDYWIGLTGIGDFGAVGQAFTLEGANKAGLPDAARNPGGSFNFPAGTDWFAIQSFNRWLWHSFALTVVGDPIPPGKCPWDIDGSGIVGAADLLALLFDWGPCKGCAADFDGDDIVGASDLLAMLFNWGPCPDGQLVYSHEFVKGVTYCPGDPQYDDWLSFRASLPTSGVTSITVSGSQDPTGRTCSDPVVAQQIADAMRTGTTLVVACGGFIWRVGIDCQEGCALPDNDLVLSVGGPICSCGSTYILRPGIGNRNWGGITGASCFVPTQTMTVTIE